METEISVQDELVPLLIGAPK